MSDVEMIGWSYTVTFSQLTVETAKALDTRVIVDNQGGLALYSVPADASESIRCHSHC